MSRPPAAREAVLDAFEQLIASEGERAATIEATAREAGVSKGGLLYHFGTRQALIEGLIERLHRLIEEDIERIDTAPDGPISYFVRSSVQIETPLDRSFIAVVRLAQGGDREAGRAIDEVRQRWLDVLGQYVADPSLAIAIALIGDGLYYHAATRAEAVDRPVSTGDFTPKQMDELVALLERRRAPSPKRRLARLS